MISLRNGCKKGRGSGKGERRERGGKGRERYPFFETVFWFFFFLQKSVTAGVVQREGSRLFHGGMTDPTGGTPMFLISSLTETLYFMVSG